MPPSDDARLSRHGRLAIYEPARPALLAAISRVRPGEDGNEIADRLLIEIDQRRRFADRVICAEERLRHSPEQRAFRLRLAEHDRHARAVFDRFDRRLRDAGAPAAALLAAQLWTACLPPPRLHDHVILRPRTTTPPPRLRETAIGHALIDALEATFGRQLRIGSANVATISGADIKACVALFGAISDDCKRRRLPLILARGKGSRRPGSPDWFAGMLRRRRKATRADSATI